MPWPGSRRRTAGRPRAAPQSLGGEGDRLKPNPPMNPLFSMPLAETLRVTARGWNAESPVMAPGVLVTAAPAGWASANGVFSVMTAPRTETMRSVSAGDPTVTVSPAANVSGLRHRLHRDDRRPGGGRGRERARSGGAQVRPGLGESQRHHGRRTGV